MSGRNTTAAFKSEIANDVIHPIYLMDLNFSAGSIYVSTGQGDIDYNGNTYKGIGDVLNISDVVETEDLRAAGITITFQALTAAYVSLALSSVTLSGTVTVYLGLLSGGSLVSGPEVLFVGKMDEVTVEQGAPHSTFVLSCENRLIRLSKPNERRYTNQDQLQYQSGDTSLRHTINVTKEFKWG